MQVPFFRPDLGEAEIAEVVATLRSGWLTTGPRTAQFETAFAAAVGAPSALALSSCTAALHLATASLGLRRGQAVLVPTMTFAASAEIVRYADAVPILVDCDPETCHLDLADAERKIEALSAGRLAAAHGEPLEVVGMIPVHVGGLMLDLAALQAFAKRHGLWVVEDAAHAFPAAWRSDPNAPWQRCGEATADVTCFSFYANKTITTGEGGMAVTSDSERAAEMRSLALHGLSTDAWGRYTAKGSWDYRILAPGYKYNLTDIASALGLHQLARADAMRDARAAVAATFRERLADLEEIQLPPDPPHRRHAWHLFPIRLRPERLHLDRDAFIAALREHGVGTSVHWRPLHLHPYYRETFGWQPHDLPVMSEVWARSISLPIFPTMTAAELDHVVTAVRTLCSRHRRPVTA